MPSWDTKSWQLEQRSLNAAKAGPNLTLSASAGSLRGCVPSHSAIASSLSSSSFFFLGLPATFRCSADIVLLISPPLRWLRPKYFGSSEFVSRPLIHSFVPQLVRSEAVGSLLIHRSS